MLKEVIHFLKEQLIKPDERLVEFKDGDRYRKFFINDQGSAKEIEELSGAAKDSLYLNTLTSLVDYIKSRELDSPHRPMGGPFYINVVNELTVKLLGRLDHNGDREHLVTAKAIVPNFDYEYFQGAEELIIGLQSKFVETEDRDLLLKVIGNVKEENVRNTGDDGVSQAVTMRSGVASSEGVKVPNPVTLAPYRTFLEAKQPESDFIFRMKDGPRGAIFEADGGAWRNEAIFNVRDYLEEQLAEEIEMGLITIIA